MRFILLFKCILLILIFPKLHASCVENVERSFKSLSPNSNVLSLWYKTKEKSELTNPAFPKDLTMRTRMGLNKCHIQGIQRFDHSGESYIVYTANSKSKNGTCKGLDRNVGGGAHLFVAKLASKAGKLNQNLESNLKGGIFSAPKADRNISNFVLSAYHGGEAPLPDDVNIDSLYHPGSFQMWKHFAFVGIDGSAHNSYIRIIDLEDPEKPRSVKEFANLGYKAQTLGVTELPDGKLLMLIGHISSGKARLFFKKGNTNKQQFKPI